MADIHDPNSRGFNKKKIRENYNETKALAEALGKDFDSFNLSDAKEDAEAIYKIFQNLSKELQRQRSEASQMAGVLGSINDALSNNNHSVNIIKGGMRGMQDIMSKLSLNELGIEDMTMDQIDKLSGKVQFLNEKIQTSKKNLLEDNGEFEQFFNKGGAAEGRRALALVNSGGGTDEDKRIADLYQQFESKVGPTVAAAMESEDLQKTILDLIESNKDLAKVNSEIYGVGGVTLDILEKTVGKLSSTLSQNLNFNAARTAMRTRRNQLMHGKNPAQLGTRTKMGMSMKVAGAGMAQLASGLLKATPKMAALGLALEFFSQLVEFDGASGDMAKNMNITYEEATKVHREMSIMAQISGDPHLSGKRMAENFSAINGLMGTTASISSEMLMTATKLKTTSGLSIEDQKGAIDLALVNNKTLAQTTGELLGQTHITSRKLGVALNEKDILKDIQNISAATTLSLGKNPKLIADAVATTKSLGFEMGKIEGMMDSLLNFEQSIEDELAAELLLGKNINLETARWAALNNDVATFAREISTQIGSAAEYGSMNRIQQEAIAKAAGMNREELASTLFLEEKLRNVSAETAAEQRKAFEARAGAVGLAQAQQEVEEKGLENLTKQMSISDQFKMMIEKIKEVLTPLITTLLPYIAAAMERIAEMLAGGGSFIGGAWDVMTGNFLDQKQVDKFSEMFEAGQGTEDLQTFKTGIKASPSHNQYTPNSHSTNQSVQYTQDGVSPPGRGPFTITDKFGATSVTASGDGLAVSPNIELNQNTITPPEIHKEKTIEKYAKPETPKIDLSPMRETNLLLKALIAKSGEVRIDSTQMGTAINMNTYSIQ